MSDEHDSDLEARATKLYEADRATLPVYLQPPAWPALEPQRRGTWLDVARDQREREGLANRPQAALYDRHDEESPQ